jgi:anti-sigma B factor antagonist
VVSIDRAEIGHRIVLGVRGEIDMDTAAELVAAIDSAVQSGAHELWVDLSTTEFMDSTGLHALLDARRRLVTLNRRLAIVCPDGAIRRLFEVAGLEDALDIYADRGAAHRDGS